MTSLIACVGEGRGTWTQVLRLIAAHNWDKVFIVTNQFGRDKFIIHRDVEKIVVPDKPAAEMSEHIRKALHGKIAGFEVAVNIESGTGTEHMALIAAVLRLGLALRLVSVDEGVVEI